MIKRKLLPLYQNNEPGVESIADITYYEPGIQARFGCNALKNFCKESIVPRASSTIFVVSLAPEQS
jgi:hypothetical protein